MLEPLDGEDNAEGKKGEDGGPDSEVAEPDVGELNDLDGELDCDIGRDQSEGCLYGTVYVSLTFAPGASNESLGHGG